MNESNLLLYQFLKEAHGWHFRHFLIDIEENYQDYCMYLGSLKIKSPKWGNIRCPICLRPNKYSMTVKTLIDLDIDDFLELSSIPIEDFIKDIYSGRGTRVPDENGNYHTLYEICSKKYFISDTNEVVSKLKQMGVL